MTSASQSSPAGSQAPGHRPSNSYHSYDRRPVTTAESRRSSSKEDESQTPPIQGRSRRPSIDTKERAPEGR
eukprot:2962698-Amphidinium_carterae.1